MRILFIFLLGLITFQVSAQQTKIIGASQFITPARLADSTEAVRFAFKKDTAFKTTTGQTFLIEDIAHLERYNNVKISMKGTTGDPTVLWFPSASSYYSQVVYRVFAQSDSVNLFFPSGGYYIGNSGVRSYHRMGIGQTSEITAVKDSANMWRWSISSSMDTISTGGGSAATITLSGNVTGSGTTSITTTIATNAVTSAKILDGTIALADLASNSVNSAKIVDASVALADMASNSVNGAKVVDYSLNGDDIGYSTLRAGDATNAVLKFANGAVLTTPASGAWEFDGNKLNFTVSGTRKRIALTNDATASNGQLPIGNGTDYTVANITAGSGITVTNGSGSISIAQTTASTAHVSAVDASVDISTQVNATAVTVVSAYLTGATARTITVPAPTSGLAGRKIVVLYNATAHGYGGILLNSSAAYSEFWAPDQSSTYLGTAYAAGGWNITMYATLAYTCRQINGTYYWCQDSYFDPFWGQIWYEYKTSVTGTTLTFTNSVTDAAYNVNKLKIYKNGLLLINGVDYTVSDNSPVTLTLSLASISGDKWVFSHQY